MFGNLGRLASLLGNLPKLKEEMEKLQERLGRITVEGDAGGGMVRVKVTGKFAVVGVTLSPEALAGGDRELLEDLVAAAANQALEKAKQAAAQEAQKLAQEFGLPAGLSLPGLGG
jgi:DNA-binding YbaB/EbfC family protein